MHVNGLIHAHPYKSHMQAYIHTHTHTHTHTSKKESGYESMIAVLNCLIVMSLNTESYTTQGTRKVTSSPHVHFHDLQLLFN